MIRSAYAIPLAGPVSRRKSLICKTLDDAAAGVGDGEESALTAAKRMSGEPPGLAVLLFDESGDGVGATVEPGDSDAEGEGDSVLATPVTGDGVLETFVAGVDDGAAAEDGVGDVAAPLDGVTIVGKTEPFKIPPANRMKSKQAKMPPYSGDSSIPLHPFVRDAKLKSASPSVGAA